MKNHSRFLSFLFCMVLSIATFAQTTISGTVTDASNGDPLIGVNIAIDGTTEGTVTDLDGQYEISTSNANPSLTVSYVGYVTQSQSASSGTLDFALKENTACLLYTSPSPRDATLSRMPSSA